MDAALKRRGRPPKDAEQKALGRRPNISLRVRQQVYDAILQAAKDNGRSMSEEMEFRIEAAFLAADLCQIVREEIARGRDMAVNNTITLDGHGCAIPMRRKIASDRDWLLV